MPNDHGSGTIADGRRGRLRGRTDGRQGRLLPLRRATQGREKEIETAFVADVDKTDLAQWDDNTTIEKPGNLGYWVGYRIAKSYYQRAADQRPALREILEMSDPKAFLAKSGWYPGIELK